jgi:hypothetical protein
MGSYKPISFLAIALMGSAYACQNDRIPSGRLASSPSAHDSVVALRDLLDKSRNETVRISLLKDTAMSKLATALELIEGVGGIEREISGNGRPGIAGEGRPSQTWAKSSKAALEQFRARFQQMSADIARLQKELKAIAPENQALAQSLADTQRRFDQMALTNARQQEHIEELMRTLDALKSENTALAAQNTVQSQTIDSLTTRMETVYWTFGTKDELLKLGIIRRKGGRNIGLTTIGETYVPSSTLDLNYFRSLDRRTETEIPLPAGSWEIVSNQQLAYAVTENASGRSFKGHITITDVRFWDGAPYLILMKK